MKYVLHILTLFCLQLQAQTTINATGYVKAVGFERKADSISVIARANSYGDYAITVPKAGYYTFTIPILNDVGIATSMSIKTPTGSTILASIPIPLNSSWQTFTAQVKLSTVSKTIRLSFADDVTIKAFTYSLNPAPDPIPSGYASKADFQALKKSFDSLKVEFNKNVIAFDPMKFKKTADSVITLITTP